jgi:hypothetical protein
MALSGLAGCLGGALFLARIPGRSGLVMAGGFSSLGLLLVVAALAFAGVHRGSWLLAPLAAALGAVAVILIDTGANLNRWDIAVGPLLIASVAVVCLVASHGLHRILDSSSSRSGVPVPPAGAQWAAYPQPGPVGGQPGHPGVPPQAGAPPS